MNCLFAEDLWSFKERGKKYQLFCPLSRRSLKKNTRRSLKLVKRMKISFLIRSVSLRRQKWAPVVSGAPSDHRESHAMERLHRSDMHSREWRWRGASLAANAMLDRTRAFPIIGWTPILLALKNSQFLIIRLKISGHFYLTVKKSSFLWETFHES